MLAITPASLTGPEKGECEEAGGAGAPYEGTGTPGGSGTGTPLGSGAAPGANGFAWTTGNDAANGLAAAIGGAGAGRATDGGGGGVDGGTTGGCGGGAGVKTGAAGAPNGATGTPGGGAWNACGGALDFGRRGNATVGSPVQSFHASVARGRTGGLPWKTTSKTARLTNFPGRAPAIDART
jgi:hypothetical protein